MKDIEAPEFIAGILKHESTYFSYMDKTQNDLLQPFAHEQELEGYSCVVRGHNKYRIVSPIFRQNLYAGAKVDLRPNDTPINLFEPNYDELFEKFPLVKQTIVYEAELKTGECIFIPSTWWIQSFAISSEDEQNTIVVDFDFEQSSMLWNTIKQGMELGSILGDTK